MAGSHSGDMGETPGVQILVAVPALNEAGHIEKCLTSLMQGDPRLQDVLFAVADGGSDDGTCDIVRTLASRAPNVRLLHNPGRYQSAGVNLAVETFGAGRTVLVRCDAHAVYPEGYVLSVADSLMRRGVEALATPMDAVGETCFQRASAFIVDTPLGSGGSAHRGGRRSGFVDHGHHAGFRLDAFRAVGGYDPSFSHNEDAELDTRLRRAGGRIFLDAGIRVAYAPRRRIADLARQYFNYGAGRARTVRKHGEPPRLRQLIPPVVFLSCLSALVLAMVHPAFLLVAAAYGALLLSVSAGSALIMRSACGLWAGPACGVMHMFWAAGFLRRLLIP